MHYTYQTRGTCSRSIEFDLNPDGTIGGLRFEGGCNGNLKGISAFSEGLQAEEIIRRLEGIRCGFKSTSCPDQLAQALKQALSEAGGRA